jgi:2,4-dichlorophenol 6-monooxygenase
MQGKVSISQQCEAAMEEIKVAVLIVGGGGCGLTASSMLSNLGVDHVLIERHADTSILPKAHVLNQRAVEILDQHRLWQSIKVTSAPPEHMCRFLYGTSLGEGSFGRTDFANPAAFGCDVSHDDYARYQRDSAYMATNLPQLRLEKILKREAELRNPGRVLFNHEAVTFTERSDGVVVEVRDRTTGVKASYVADYVVAADGGKTFGPALGITMEGPVYVADATSVHIKADLSPYWHDGDLMCWLASVIDPASPLATPGGLFGADWTTIVQMGPTWGKESEEFVVHLSLGQKHTALEELTDDDFKACIRRGLGIADLEMEVLKASRWHIQGIYAMQYQSPSKRIFLAGDAAHRHPPTTGLGLNTAIGDAHNLTWKLAEVLKGHASPSLLDTYEAERQPVGKRVVQWALFTFMNFRHLDTAVGLLPGPKEMQQMNPMLFQQLCEDSFNGAARRAAVAYAAQSQRVEFAAHDLDIGAVYAAGALLGDSTTAPFVDPRGHVYTPTARPGHRLPHAWLQGPKRISTHHLLDHQGSWLLLTDDSAEGTRWLVIAAEMTLKFGLKITAVKVGESGNFKDEGGQWRKDSGLEGSTGGAVLVRPDGYVALRAASFVANAVDQLGTILGF